VTKGDIIIEYSGAVSFETIDSLLDQLKSLPEFRRIEKGVKKRLYCICNESLENINKYAAKETVDASSRQPYIRLEELMDSFIIASGNLIGDDNINSLQSRLEKINKQDREALKESYGETINQERSSVEYGAGLGLITIALQSRNRITYSFTPADHNLLYFEMKILITKPDVK